MRLPGASAFLTLKHRYQCLPSVVCGSSFSSHFLCVGHPSRLSSRSCSRTSQTHTSSSDSCGFFHTSPPAILFNRCVGCPHRTPALISFCTPRTEYHAQKTFPLETTLGSKWAQLSWLPLVIDAAVSKAAYVRGSAHHSQPQKPRTISHSWLPTLPRDQRNQTTTQNGSARKDNRCAGFGIQIFFP